MTHDELFELVLAELREELGEFAPRVSVCVGLDIWQNAHNRGSRQVWGISTVFGDNECEASNGKETVEAALSEFRRSVIPSIKAFFGIAIVEHYDPIALGM